MSEFNPTPTPAVGPTVESLIKRAFLFLEDGDFQNANTYSERVLDINPENADAYLVKLLIQFRVRHVNQLQNQPYRLEPSVHYQKILRFGSDSLKKQLETINFGILYNLACDAMQKARSDADFKKVAAMFDEIQGFRDATERRDTCYARANAIIAEIQARQRAAMEQQRRMEEQRRAAMEAQRQQYIRQQQMLEQQRQQQMEAQRQQYLQQQRALEQQRQMEEQHRAAVEAQQRAAMEAQKKQIEEEQKRIIEENKIKIAEAQALKAQQEAEEQAKLQAEQAAIQAKADEKLAKANEKEAKKAAKIAEKEAKKAEKQAEKEAKKAAKKFNWLLFLLIAAGVLLIAAGVIGFLFWKGIIKF